MFWSTLAAIIHSFPSEAGGELGAGRPGGVGKQTHQLLVQRELGWLTGTDIGQHCAREGRARNRGRNNVGQKKTQSLSVEEEERFILDNWAAHRGRPLVRVGERPRG